jgi:hypothetical protein
MTSPGALLPNEAGSNLCVLNASGERLESTHS